MCWIVKYFRQMELGKTEYKCFVLLLRIIRTIAIQINRVLCSDRFRVLQIHGERRLRQLCR